MQYFSVAAAVVVIGWYGLVRRLPAGALARDGAWTIALVSLGLLVVGGLFEFLGHDPSFENHAALLSTVSFGAEALGNSLVALATGAWVGSLLINPLARLGSRALIPVWIITAAIWVALLTRESVYASRLDAWIIVGVASSWTFLLGYLLCDPLIHPLMERLDKQIERLPDTMAWIVERLRSNIAVSVQWLRAKVASIAERLRSPKTKADAIESHQVPAVIPEDAVASWDVPSVSAPSTMQLKLKRSQRKSLMGKMIFVLDARMEVPQTDRELIKKYRLGNDVIYDSTARQRHTETLKAHLESTKEHTSYRDTLDNQLLGIGKTMFRFALAGVSATRANFSLRVTVDSLMKGQTVECKDMGELLGVEQAIRKAGENLRIYLNTAYTFGGQEEILEF